MTRRPPSTFAPGTRVRDRRVLPPRPPRYGTVIDRRTTSYPWSNASPLVQWDDGRRRPPPSWDPNRTFCAVFRSALEVVTTP